VLDYNEAKWLQVTSSQVTQQLLSHTSAQPGSDGDVLPSHHTATSAAYGCSWWPRDFCAALYTSMRSHSASTTVLMGLFQPVTSARPTEWGEAQPTAIQA